MRFARILLTTIAILSLTAAGASAQQPPDPLGRPLFPDFLVSHATDGVAPDGARAHTGFFVTNAGFGPLAAEIAFVPDTGFPATPFAVPAIAPGATVHVLLRTVVGAAAPPFVAGTVHVRFFRPVVQPTVSSTSDVQPDPPFGVVAAYLTTILPSAPGIPAPPPQTIPLDVRPLHPLAPCPHPPCAPPPCPTDHPCPGPDLACVPAPGAQCELAACPADHPCPTPDRPCAPAPGASCGPPPCPADHPCPGPNHPCTPPPGANCGAATWKNAPALRAD